MTVSGQSSPVTYAYDNDNRLTRITQGTAGVSFGYDAAGRRTALTLPDGIVVNYGYDQASELTGLSYSQGGNVLGDLTYAYDADGRRTQMSGTWARTGMPNPTTSTAVYNVDNELTNWNGATLTYDLNGNLVNDSANTYTWSARNQLASISGTTAASFVYGPFGRRQQKTINGATTDFLYDGVNPVQELSGTTVTANLLTGLGVDEYFTRTDSTGTADFLSDALGSTIALADSSGTVQTAYTYAPFGGTTTQGTGSANAFQFTGRENDGDGLYYYRARYYDPMLSRFVSEDPNGLTAGPNLYSYAGDAPSLFVDPVGLDKSSPLKREVCSAVPGGRVVSLGGSIGGVGGETGSVSEVINYNTGEISAFATGGLQVGWNGGASASASMGFAQNLPNNSSYSGAFNNISGGVPGGPGASYSWSSSGTSVTSASVNATLLPSPTWTYSRTWTSPPLHVGNIWSNVGDPLTPLDLMLYAARQACR